MHLRKARLAAVAATGAALILAAVATGTFNSESSQLDPATKDMGRPAGDVILSGTTADGRPYAIIERRSAEGTCLELDVDAKGGVEACGVTAPSADSPLSLMTHEDYGSEDQFVWGIGQADADEFAVSTGGARAERARAASDTSGRMKVFAYEVRGRSAERTITVTARSRGANRATRSIALRGPNQGTFRSDDDRAREFDFGDGHGG